MTSRLMQKEGFDQPANPLSCLNTEPRRTKHLEENQNRFELLEYFPGVGFDGAHKFTCVPIFGSFVSEERSRVHTRMVR